LTERDKERLKQRLMMFAACGLLVTQFASVVHMTTSLGWANSQLMAIAMALALVAMSGTLLILSIITTDGFAKNVLMLGTCLLVTAELAGNYAVAGLLVDEKMPAEVAGVFGVSESLASHSAAFLFGGVFPVLVLVTLIALAKTAETMLNQSAHSARTEQWIQSIHGAWDEEDVPISQGS
jgi:hypothetical protein